jgi:DUF917 family protein
VKQLSIENLAYLSSGAALLGSGGGGDAVILTDFLHYLLSQHGPVDIISLAELKPDDLVVPLAMIGAPLVCIERIPNQDMFVQLFTQIKRDYPDKNIVLMPAEIGGCNALTPFLLASIYHLPVLDGDLIGRAFPKINMCKPAVNKVSNLQAYVSSALGECVHFVAHSMPDLEDQARQITMRFGCSAAFSTFIFTADQQEKYVIPNSIMRAFELGRQLQAKQCPEATLITAGVITEVEHRIENGFLMGHAIIRSQAETYKILFQNEYLLVFKGQEIIAESPTIISLLETRSKTPIASESLRYGLQVELVSLAPPAFWDTPSALAQVNRTAFGMNVEDLKYE